MSRAIFLFIASLYLLLPFFQGTDDIPTTTQFIYCAPFIIFLGIPHGAIDNLLYLRKRSTKPTTFLTIYIIAILLNVVFWIVLPVVSYAAFLLVSAFHFGQSQFSQYLKGQSSVHFLLYTLWGISILSGLIHFNMNEIHQIMSANFDFQGFIAFHNPPIFKTVFIGSTLSLIAMLGYLKIDGHFKLQMFLMEMIVLALIFLSFYLLPLLIGFTMYFVILHAFKVMREEFYYLKSHNVIASVRDFIVVLTPFTLLSIAGVAILFGTIYLDVFKISYGYAFLIAISSISLPHIFVMNKFYDQLLKQG